jgi:hypothetical protein
VKSSDKKTTKPPPQEKSALKDEPKSEPIKSIDRKELFDKLEKSIKSKPNNEQNIANEKLKDFFDSSKTNRDQKSASTVLQDELKNKARDIFGISKDESTPKDERKFELEKEKKIPKNIPKEILEKIEKINKKNQIEQEKKFPFESSLKINNSM